MNLTDQDILKVLMRWRARLSGAAWLVVRDAHAAEDIFQSVALKAMTRDVTFEAEAPLVSWAFITARRESVDWLRKHQREVLGLDAEILEVLHDEWQSASAPPSGAKIEALRDCLESLPDASHSMLKLRYMEGLSCEEVADHVGAGLNAVYKRLSRLHLHLKECVDSKLRPQYAPEGNEC